MKRLWGNRPSRCSTDPAGSRNRAPQYSAPASGYALLVTWSRIPIGPNQKHVACGTPPVSVACAVWPTGTVGAARVAAGVTVASARVAVTTAAIRVRRIHTM